MILFQQHDKRKVQEHCSVRHLLVALRLVFMTLFQQHDECKVHLLCALSPHLEACTIVMQGVPACIWPQLCRVIQPRITLLQRSDPKIRNCSCSHLSSCTSLVLTVYDCIDCTAAVASTKHATPLQDGCVHCSSVICSFGNYQPVTATKMLQQIVHQCMSHKSHIEFLLEVHLCPSSCS